jgi:hypothetical protein
MYQRKTKDVWVIEGFWSSQYGWELETSEESYKEAKCRLKEYRDNQPEVNHRIRLTRERINP